MWAVYHLQSDQGTYRHASPTKTKMVLNQGWTRKAFQKDRCTGLCKWGQGQMDTSCRSLQAPAKISGKIKVSKGPQRSKVANFWRTSFCAFIQGVTLQHLWIPSQKLLLDPRNRQSPGSCPVRNTTIQIWMLLVVHNRNCSRQEVQGVRMTRHDKTVKSCHLACCGTFIMFNMNV